MFNHIASGCAGLLAVFGSAFAAHPVPFEVRVLTVDANEGCDVADVDGDGKLDVIAGRNWYQNPGWVSRPVRLIDDWNGYVRSNGETAYDVNGDGRPDVVSIDFTTSQLYWYENPGGEPLLRGYLWPQHLLVDTKQTTNEMCLWVDMTGDGRPEMIANQWNPKNPTIVWRFARETREVDAKPGAKVQKKPEEVPTMIGSTIGPISAHGIGYGDINNDGRPDIVHGHGWYECPTGDPLDQPWPLHEDWEQHASCPMLVYDVDGDGKNDVVTSNAHGFGIFWWRGLGPDAKGKLQFEEHLIDDSFSQAHCLVLADLDGDGSAELVTGKRVRAHNGGDPGSGDPPTMRYYAWNGAQQAFEKYTIETGSAGAGLQIRCVDLDADADLDIVVAGKDGTQILWNRRTK